MKITCLGIIHDWSKILPSELFPYAYYDFEAERNEVGYCKSVDTGDLAFDFAWLLHQKRNKHHWQFWTLAKDDGTMKILEMPEKYRKEMLCDWVGAGKAQGYGKNTKEWYTANRDKMQLTSKTRKLIEKEIAQL